MADVEKYADELVRVSEIAGELVKAISGSCGGSFQWSVKEISKSFKSMFDRFCPYKVGDRVFLTATPPSALEQDSGWYTSRHFLIPGAVGTVRGRGYHNEQFVFDIEFDNESWVDDKGTVHPVEQKHVYSLSEKYLR